MCAPDISKQPTHTLNPLLDIFSVYPSVFESCKCTCADTTKYGIVDICYAVVLSVIDETWNTQHPDTTIPLFIFIFSVSVFIFYLFSVFLYILNELKCEKKISKNTIYREIYVKKFFFSNLFDCEFVRKIERKESKCLCIA